MRLRPITIAILTLSILTNVFGQQRPSPADNSRKQDATAQEDVVRVTTNLVQADVLVTDKAGRQVIDLRPEDFEILEDGERQQITNFSYVAVGESAPAASAQPLTPAPPARKNEAPVMPARLKREQVRRTIALVVDDLGLSFESIGFVRGGLRKFVDEQMGPNDLVAILRTSSGAGAQQQFTNDKRRLYAAVERVRWYPGGRGGVSPVATLNEESAGSDMRDTVQFVKEAEEERAGLYSVGTFGVVGGIVQGLGEMPGRKSLVFISEAFRLFTAQGRNTQLIQAMQRLTNQANAASVSIYTVDASGIQTDVLDAADKAGAPAYVISAQDFAQAGVVQGSGVAPNAAPRTLSRTDTLSAQAEQDSASAFRRLGALMEQRREGRTQSHSVLSYLAANTGGLFMKNRNDIGSAVEQIIADQKGYYLIGYRPDDSTVDKTTGRRGGLHRLEVKVKRPGLIVRARDVYAGLTEGAPGDKPRTREEQFTKALTSPFASGDIDVRLTSLFGDEPGGGTFMRSLLHIDANDLTFKEEGNGARRAEVEMVAVAFGDGGQPVDQLSYPQSVRVADEAEYRRLLNGGLTYILNIPVKKPGAYQMRVAARDSSSERMGAASQYVEVPDLSKNRLALSGIVLSGVEPGAAPEPDPQLGPAVRRLRQGVSLEYRYYIYNARTGAEGRPQVQTQMRLFRDGKEVFVGKVMPLAVANQADAKRLGAVGRLRLGPELTPGQYVLQVVVTDQLAPETRRTATQWMDFEIVQ